MMDKMEIRKRLLGKLDHLVGNQDFEIQKDLRSERENLTGKSTFFPALMEH